MKEYCKEGSVLFGSVIKWIILASLTGLIVGGATTFFLKLLDFSVRHVRELPFKYYLLLPFAIFTSIFLIRTFAKDAEGHGTEKVLEAIHKKEGKIDIFVVPIKLLTTIITISFGGSAGKEGPSAQIGAGIMSFISQKLKLSKEERKKLIICGISAGFGAVFGTPVAAAIFAIEVLFVGSILYEVLLPSFISSIVAIKIAKYFGIPYHFFNIEVPTIHGDFLYIQTILAGMCFALVGFLLIYTLKNMEHISSKFKHKPYLKALLASLFIIFIALIFGEESLGLGTNTMYAMLEGETKFWYTPILKIITTATTLSFGGSGGILTPVFVIGAGTGSFIGKLFNSSTAFFAALGLVSLLAGACNTPLSAIMLSIELFGMQIAPYSGIATTIAFVLIGHRSVYPTQILAMKKTASFDIELGKEIKESSIINYWNRNKKKVEAKVLNVKLGEDNETKE